MEHFNEESSTNSEMYLSAASSFNSKFFNTFQENYKLSSVHLEKSVHEINTNIASCSSTSTSSQIKFPHLTNKKISKNNSAANGSEGCNNIGCDNKDHVNDSDSSTACDGQGSPSRSQLGLKLKPHMPPTIKISAFQVSYN